MINYQINYHISHLGNCQRAGRRAGKGVHEGQGPVRDRAVGNPGPGSGQEGRDRALAAV